MTHRLYTFYYYQGYTGNQVWAYPIPHKRTLPKKNGRTTNWKTLNCQSKALLLNQSARRAGEVLGSIEPQAGKRTELPTTAAHSRLWSHTEATRAGSSPRQQQAAKKHAPLLTGAINNRYTQQDIHFQNLRQIHSREQGLVVNGDRLGGARGKGGRILLGFSVHASAPPRFFLSAKLGYGSFDPFIKEYKIWDDIHNHAN